MQVNYKNHQIEKICTNASVAAKRFDKRTVGLIQQRVDEIHAADSVEMLVQFGIGRCHQLVGDRKGQFAMDLVHPQRLVFEVIRDEIQIAEIQEIVDYH
jgi:proteic killer suppression protein